MNLNTEILSELWMLNNFDRVLAFSNCCRVLLFFKYSLLYIEVWNEHCKCHHIQKESLLKLDLSPMISCLIKVLSYEGSILNPFQLRGIIVAGVVVFQSCYPCLVVETQNRVVVVQFVQSTFVNALCIFATKWLQIFLKWPLHNSTSLLPIWNEYRFKEQLLRLQILQVKMNLSFWWNVASDDVITSGAPSLQER